jgi:hypothetical protein
VPFDEAIAQQALAGEVFEIENALASRHVERQPVLSRRQRARPSVVVRA